MVKKRVPEWLNSSLWSSTPSHDDEDRQSRYSTRPITNTNTISSLSTVEPTVIPPVTVPPPAATRVEPSKPPETKDSPSSKSSISDLSHNGISEEAGPSVEDISRQAQLLAEVSPIPVCVCVCKMCDNYVFVEMHVCIYVNVCHIYGNVVIKEGDKHEGFAKNCVAGHTGWFRNSFHCMEGMHSMFDL